MSYLFTKSNGNPKTAKGEELAIENVILHLAPHKLAGGKNVCPFATPACIKSCLNTAGRGGIFKKGETTNMIQEARKRKTRFYNDDPIKFLEQLQKEINSLRKRAAKRNAVPTVRLNGTSDILWEKTGIIQANPDVQFYDYTKAPVAKRFNVPANYHLTFSYGETKKSQDNARVALENGFNIAVVFRKEFPDEFMGSPTINGDVHDFRFLDKTGKKGFVVALKAKGKAKKDESGFVV